jgi:NDP-sugar pyrophosphorylase family protein
MDAVSPVCGLALAAEGGSGGAGAGAGSGSEGGKPGSVLLSVKRSVIGKHCKIGVDVKIADSIIMDHVTIEDGSARSLC